MTGGYTQSVNDAIQALYKSGVPVVVAAGNYASDACMWSPASASNAITVAGSAEGDRLYSKTNYGSCIDIFAPGHNVQGANHMCSDCYQFKSGTSFAAPLVSGAVAILLQRQPRLTPDQILYQLISLSTNNTLDTDSIPANFTSSTPNRLLFIPESCGGKLSIGLQSVIRIESPNYPLNYFKKTVCKWLITGPLNTYVRISFTNFSTEPFYDRIELYQGTSCDPNITQLATLSGKRDELAFTQCDSLSNSLLVEFRTDSLISDTGFRANILVAQTRQKQTVVVGLEESTYLVNEDEGRVKVCVAISNLHTCCPVTHNFSVTLQHTPGSATVGSDYIFDDRRSTLQFGTCDKRKCFFIGTVNNHQVETDESFTLTLVNNSFESDIELAMMSANVTILDDDVASVGLEHTDYSVEEGQEVRVCARLMTSRGSCTVSFPFSVVVNTEYGSAVSPEDYVTVSNESLSFAPCTTNVCFNITTHDDTLPEGNEEFHVILSRGPDLNSRIHLDHIMNMAVVTVLDDDGE
ncbi:Proprotein convertase subtilisin/kexin type 9 [Geodia barretti]|uniref:Proprotein convertase subtilisin/kexin type 9 n=1 Tax=Geodia barretti TaxID=519541 RepID=A0AA35T1Y8_GEOBA|nr:Proprotein convertase subtilisin/kexin type 9 [Geodia barretti]